MTNNCHDQTIKASNLSKYLHDEHTHFQKGYIEIEIVCFNAHKKLTCIDFSGTNFIRQR